MGEANTPIACSLQPGELDARQQRITSLARRDLLQQHREGDTLTMRFARAASAELRALVALEQECCAFARFELRELDDAIELRIAAPREAQALLEELFGGVSASSSTRGCNSACTCAGA